jgi:hypothetical protein
MTARDKERFVAMVSRPGDSLTARRLHVLHVRSMLYKRHDDSQPWWQLHIFNSSPTPLSMQPER